MLNTNFPTRGWVRVALACAMMLAACGSSDGLTFNEIPEVSEVAAMASLAFRGKIVDLDYRHVQVSEEQTIPYSRITLQVAKGFGGIQGSKVTLREIGGQLRDHPTRYLIIPGLADLTVGERIYVLANDRLQPFFATLYGDYSLYRIAEDESGRHHVLNAHWQLLETDGERIWAVRGRYCEVTKEDRGRCRTRTREGGDISDLHDVVVRTGRPLDPETFDALIEQWRKEGARRVGEQGQTVSANDETFAAAVRDFGLAVSKRAPEDSETESSLSRNRRN
jgi:hypothetical protein